MALNRSARAAGITLLLMVAFCGWYAIAADYGYGALAGTYTYSGNGESSTLVLKSDRTFEQRLQHDGKVDHTVGTWHREGEGGVVFSGAFLRLPGQRSFADSPGSEEATWQHPEFYGHFEKILTVYPKLSLDGGDKEVVLHRRLFH
jgi:hypothetical protein